MATTRAARRAARCSIRWCATAPSSTSPWAPWSTIRPSARASTSSSAPRRRGSPSPTICRNTPRMRRPPHPPAARHRDRLPCARASFSPGARSLFQRRRLAHARTPDGRVVGGGLRRLIAVVSLAELQGLGDLEVAPPEMTAQHDDERAGAYKDYHCNEFADDHSPLPDHGSLNQESAPTPKVPATQKSPATVAVR